MRLRSFKLRFADAHVRVVLDTEAPGPGVDLLGVEAKEAFRLAEPLLRVIAAIDPNGRVRSLAMDLERPRMTATLEPSEGAPVVRLDDGPALRRALEDLSPLLAYLLTASKQAVLRRPSGA